MKFVPLFLFAAALLAGTAYAKIERTVEKSFTVQAGGKLHLETQGGDIRVMPSTDGLVKITAREKITASSEGEADEVLKKLELTLEQSGNDVSGIAKYDRSPGMHWGSWPPVQVDFIVTAPASFSTDLHTSGGDVTLGPVNTIAKTVEIGLMTATMEMTEAHLERIKEALPVERGNVRVEVLNFLNAVLYVAENGCKWRRLPERYGNWHTIYTRMNRWSKKGVWARVFARLQEEGLMEVKVQLLALDSTAIKVHPDGTGAEKKTARRPSANPAAAGPPRFIWLPLMMSGPRASGFRAETAATARKAAS
jgi:transposase